MDNPIKLSPKQLRFIEEYTVDFNATAAATRAGYSEKTAYSIGHANMKKDEIKALISERITALTMSADEALKRLSDMARGSFEPFLKVDEDNNILLDLTTDQAKENIKLIKKVKQTKSIIGDTLINVQTEIEIHDAKDAITKILQLHGKLIDRNVNVKTKIDGLSEQDLDAIIEEVLKAKQ